MNRRNSGWWAALFALALLAGCDTSQAESTTTEVEVQPPQVQEEQAAEMPVDEPAAQEDAAAALRELLEEQLSAGKQMAGGTWSACVLPLDDAEPVIMNARPLRSASLIKLFVAGAVCEQWDAVDAQAQYAGETDELLQKMLSVSDNDATNTLVRRLGGGDASSGMEQVNAYCEENGYADSSMGRLMLDFDAAGDNFTSAADCCAILRAVEQGETAGADRILTALKEQERTGKLPAGVPDGVMTANKTGELDDVENDAAIVWAQDGTYILCVMVDGVSDPAAARTQITALSSAVYTYFEPANT